MTAFTSLSAEFKPSTDTSGSFETSWNDSQTAKSAKGEYPGCHPEKWWEVTCKYVGGGKGFTGDFKDYLINPEHYRCSDREKCRKTLWEKTMKDVQTQLEGIGYTMSNETFAMVPTIGVDSE